MPPGPIIPPGPIVPPIIPCIIAGVPSRRIADLLCVRTDGLDEVRVVGGFLRDDTGGVKVSSRR